MTEKLEADIWAAKEKAGAANIKALAASKPWDTHIKHADVDESTGEMFTVTKPIMDESPMTVYVDGKMARTVHVLGNIMAVSMKPSKAAPAPAKAAPKPKAKAKAKAKK